VKKGWERKRLGEVCAFDKLQGIHHGLPYVGLEHIESHTAHFIGSIDPQPVKSSTFRFSDKHVLYGRLRPYLNKALAPDFAGHCSTEIFPLKPRPELSREYLLFWLLSDETCDRINATCTGARMPRAQMNEVMDFDFPLPPLPEQHRIVGLLDEAFAGLATAKANAEKNLQNARELFESHLNEVFSKKGEGWVEKRLGEVGTTQTGSTPKTSDQSNYGSFISFIKPGDFNPDGSLDYEKEGLSVRGFDLSRKVAANSALMVCIGATIGKCGYCDRDVTTNQQINSLTPHQGINHMFMYYQMLTEDFQRRVRLNAGQATLPIISKGKWSALTVLVPPSLEEQERVASRLDALSAETRRLAQIYEKKQAALAALKKSLLHQAFSGAL
jgi:type I restriction enzyme, S subunit